MPIFTICFRTGCRPAEHLENLVPFADQVVLLLCRSDVLFGVVIPAAQKAESNRLALHGNFSDFAVVVAELADLIFDRNRFFMKRKAPERGALEPLFRQHQRTSQGARHMAEFGDEDWLFQPVFEGGNQSLVAGRRTLEADSCADVGFDGHLGQIIFANRMEDACQHFIDRVSFG